MIPDEFEKLYKDINAEDPDLFYIERGNKYVDLDVLIDELEYRGIHLSEEDENTLIAELFFRDAIIVKGAPSIFDYSDPTSFRRYTIEGQKTPSTPPRTKKVVALSPANTFQGERRSCFVHSAANVILHNVYKLSLEDEATYTRNNCNQYLDTSKEFGDYDTIVANCGESGALRILLFHYIYRVIAKRYGDDFGPLGDSILYYLQQPFRDDIFPELNHIIHPVFESKDLRLYSLSSISIDWFKTRQYERYFEEYYASLYIKKPAHFFTIVGIDSSAVHCKDSYTGKPFTIPMGQFNKNGTVTIDDSTWKSPSYIYLLYETSKLDSYPAMVRGSIQYPKEPDPRAAEEPTKGGRKTRKGKRRKTKRTRKN